MFWFGNRTPKSNGSIFFIFVAVIGTLIIASAVLSLSGKKRIKIEEMPPEEDAALIRALPSGVTGGINSLNLRGRTAPSVVVAYRDRGDQFLGLVRWNRQKSGYTLEAKLRLVEESRAAGLPDISQPRLGWGKHSVIALRWSADAGSARTISYVFAGDDDLRQVQVRRKGGVVQPAVFSAGEFGDETITLEVKDYDGDKVEEVLRTRITEEGRERVDVFLWKEGMLTWNEQWSEAMMMRESLFPEPAESDLDS